MLELFRIQDHWDGIRQRDTVGFLEFRQMIEKQNEQLLEMMGLGMGNHHGGEEKRETDERKARRLVLEELRKRRWVETHGYHHISLREKRKKTEMRPATNFTCAKVSIRAAFGP